MRETDLEVKTLGTGSARVWESANVQKASAQIGAQHRERKSTKDDTVSVDCGGVGFAFTSFQESLVSYFSQGVIRLSFERFCDCRSPGFDLARSFVS